MGVEGDIIKEVQHPKNELKMAPELGAARLAQKPFRFCVRKSLLCRSGLWLIRLPTKS